MRALSARATVRSAMLLGVALALSACADGIELNGKVFDAMGVNNSVLGGQKKEPNMPVRGGLVMPPSTASLPAPGSPEAIAAAAPQQWPDDPNAKLAQTEAAQQAAANKGCSSGQSYSNANSDNSKTKNNKLAQCGTIWSLLFNPSSQPSATASTSDITPASAPPPGEEPPAETQTVQ